jgi:hypothetical protein
VPEEVLPPELALSSKAETAAVMPVPVVPEAVAAELGGQGSQAPGLRVQMEDLLLLTASDVLTEPAVVVVALAVLSVELRIVKMVGLVEKIIPVLALGLAVD